MFNKSDLAGSESATSENADRIIESAIAGEAFVELTHREQQILSLILGGKTNKEIARQICRVERTIEFHRNKLMHKLGARNSTELALKAVQAGFIPT
jgi:DNA-binding NarL/FixJ family response regulator